MTADSFWRNTLVGGCVAAALAATAVGQEGPRISLDVKEKPLPDVVAYLKEKAGRNILLGKNPEGRWLNEVWPPVVVTVRLDEVPWEKALESVAEAAGCVVERQGAVWKLYQPALVDLDEENADFREVVTRIADAGRGNVIVGSDVPKDLRVSVRLRRVPWSRALRAVVKAAGMALVRVGGGEAGGEPWEIGPGPAAPRDPEPPAARAPDEALVRQAEAILEECEARLKELEARLEELKKRFDDVVRELEAARRK